MLAMSASELSARMRTSRHNSAKAELGIQEEAYIYIDIRTSDSKTAQ